MSTGQGGQRAQAFFGRLASLYEAAGTPTYESLAAHCRLNQQTVSVSSLQEWMAGKTVPRSEIAFRVLAERLEALARRRLGPDHKSYRPETRCAWREEAARERRRRHQAANPPASGVIRADDVLDDPLLVVGEIPREPPAFVSRRALERLAESAVRGRVAVVWALTGLRGVGKTQVAAAYARGRIQARTGLVAWVNAESRDSMLADLVRVADALGVGDPEGDSLESVRRLREHLDVRGGRGVIVFDNAADPDILRPFLPATGGTQVVITSTGRAFAEFGTAIEVSTFGRGESLGYLAKRTALADRDGAIAIAEALGDLPLGLSQAAATISGQRLTYQSYLKRLRQVPVADLLGRVPGGDYPRATAAALLLNTQAAEADDPSGLVARMLRVVAALSADGVRREVLEGLTGFSGALRSGKAGEVDVAAEHCVSWSLLSWSVTGDAVIMHRLLSRVVRERDRADGQWAHTVTSALALLEPLLFDEDQAWARRDEGSHLAAHAEALWEAAAHLGPASPELDERVSTLGHGPCGNSARRLTSPGRSSWARKPLQTASGCSAQTTPTPSPRGATSPRPTAPRADSTRRFPVRADDDRLRAGPGSGSPGHPHLAERPRGCLPVRGPGGQGDSPLPAGLGRSRTGPWHGPPAHARLAERPRRCLRRRGPAGRRTSALRAHCG